MFAIVVTADVSHPESGSLKEVQKVPHLEKRFDMSVMADVSHVLMWPKSSTLREGHVEAGGEH
eukprot:5238798-Prymnesium_polylepis.1